MTAPDGRPLVCVRRGAAVDVRDDRCPHVGHPLSALDAPDVRPAGARVPPAWTEAVAVRERVLVAGIVRESRQIAHDGARQPRTAVGLTADGHTALFVVVNGRGEHSGGATTRARGVGWVIRR